MCVYVSTIFTLFMVFVISDSGDKKIIYLKFLFTKTSRKGRKVSVTEEHIVNILIYQYGHV